MSDDVVHFLLVDDLEGNLLSLEAVLRRDGLQCLKATSGVEALELLLEHEVALAIVDVQMPGMDGFELAELMRGNERTRRVPIVFLTAGSADYQRRFRGYEAGAVDFLHKPIEPDILRSKAEVFFELFRQRQQIASQRDALELADRRKDEFLAVLAHELRNPLTPLRYGLDIMRLFPDKPLEGDIRAMMDRQLTHLVRLIDDLMDVSRISRGKIELRRERIAIQSAVEAAVEASRPLIDSKGHQLDFEIPGEPLWVEGDITRLSQVLCNLLNNAAKYTADGGRIGISLRRSGAFAELDITDNGIGIPGEMLMQIFELFTQVERDSERARSGLGIGLALARQLVELHGGSLDARSPGDGAGTTFTLRLPLQETGPEHSPPGNIEAGHRKPLKIVIADDDTSSAEATARILSMIGHEVVFAHDGASALELSSQTLPDVVVLDLGMPGMDGCEVCRQLRRDPRFAKATLIAQTGWGQAEDRAKTRAAGFDHHLTKPVNFDELAGILAEV